MIAITSISPGHKNFDNQRVAIDSWINAGYEVVSLNVAEEIEVLEKEFKGVKFVPTFRHTKHIFGKPYVTASALIDYIKEAKSKYSLLINSDIIIDDQKNSIEKIKEDSETGIIIMNRRDFINSLSEGVVYDRGFDGFFINYKWIDIFPQTILSLGQCFWDYWVPYSAIVNKVKVMKLKEPYLFHKKHNVQYSVDQWRRTGDIFKAEMGLAKFARAEQVSDYVFKQIRLHTR